MGAGQGVRWRRRLGIGAGLAALLVALAALAGPGLLRAVVCRLLAERLQAGVQIAGVRWLSPRTFLLERLVVEHPRIEPRLESVRALRVEVVGSPLDILAGNMASIDLDGVEARLARAAPGGFPRTPPRAAGVRRLTLRHAWLLLPDDAAGRVSLELRAEDLGGSPRGYARFEAASVDLRSLGDLGLLPVGLRLGGLRGMARVAGPRVALSARADQVEVAPGSGLGPLSFLTVEATTEPALDRPGGRRVSLDVAVSSHLRARGQLVLDARGRPVPGSRGDLRADDLRALCARFASAETAIECDGSARGLVAVGGDGRMRFSASAFLARLAWAGTAAASRGIPQGGRVEGVCLAVEAAPGGSEAATVAVELGLDVDSAEVMPHPWLARALFPLTVHISGDVAPGPVTAASLRAEGSLPEGASFTLEGGLSLDVATLAPDVDLRVRASLPDLDRAAKRVPGLLPPGVELSGTAAAALRLRGYPRTLAAAGELAAKSLTLAAPGFAVRGTSVRIEGAAGVSPPRTDVNRLRASGSLEVPPLDPIPFVLAAGGGRFSAPSGGASGSGSPAGRIERVQLELRGIPPLAGSVSTGAGTTRVQLRSRPGDLAPVVALLAPLTGPLPAGVTARGGIEAELDATLAAGGALRAGGRLRVVDAGVVAGGGARLVQGIAADLALDARRPAADGRLELRAAGPVSGFEFLWDSVYADLRGAGSTLGLELDRDPVRGDGIRVRLALPEAVAVSADVSRPRSEAAAPLAGSKRGERTAFTLGLQVPDLAAAWRRYVVEATGASPAQLERGRLEVELTGAATGGSGNVRGRVRLQQLDLAVARPAVEARSASLDLPFDLLWTGRADGTRSFAGPERRGTLSFERLSLGGVALEGASVGIVAEADAVRIEAPLRTRLYGGDVELEGLRLERLLGRRRLARARLRFSRLDLAALARARGLPALEGTLDATFPEVALGGEELETRGTASVTLFGGRVELGRIAVAEPFSRYPRVSFDASFEGIDLGAATLAFDFGHVSGVLRGTVADCELFGGTPVRFRAEVLSVETPGVKQRIDVRAIRNLAVLGSGERTSLFDSGFRRFLRTYAYDAIGARMVLEDDRFLLRGLVSRGDRELLLKGRFPFRVDVVLAEPGRTVSFQTMMERFRALDLKAVRTSP